MIWFILAYILVQLGIGIWASKHIKNELDFLVAGRSVPGFLLVISLFATWFGAETVIGTSGEVYKHGLSGSRADPFGYSICLLLLGFLIAGRIWKPEFLTLGDFFKSRFSPRTEKLAILILFISSVIWAAAQIRAFGQILSHYSELPIGVTMTIGFGLVVSYSLLGGLMGDILTDALQGLILVLGLVILSWFVIRDLDIQNWSHALTSERLTWTLPNESWASRIERWMIPILGSLVAQESITRILSAKSAKDAQKISWISSVIYLVVGSLPVLVGLFGVRINLNFDHQEQFIVALSQKYLNPIGQAIFVGALVSAILSTVDSILLSGGGLLSHNFLIPKLKIQKETQKLFLTRLALVMMASLAFAIALSSEGIYQLVELASSWGSAGILTITLFGLWSKLGGSQSANLTLITGVISLPVLEYGLQSETPFLITVFLCVATYLIASYFFREVSDN
jgi:Na+/proline symporter